MTELDALKAQLREAKERLATRKRPNRTYDDSANLKAHPSRLWDLKLQMAMEHNYELEKRLAWEIETRNLVEQYTRQQIRHLQGILEKLLRQLQHQQSQGLSASTGPINSNAGQGFPSATHTNSLSPLLTEVMHVQLKFAETMQSLNQSVQTRENLLFSTPPHATSRRRRHREPEDDDADSDGDVDVLPSPSYTTFLGNKGTLPSMHDASFSSLNGRSSTSRPTTFHSSSNDNHAVSSSLAFTSPLAGPDSATPQTDDSKRSVHFLDTTPTVGRAISFNDCHDDDDDDNRSTQEPARSTPSTKGVMDDTPADPPGAFVEDSSITSSALNRSSFLEDFDNFRNSLKMTSTVSGTGDRAVLHDTYTTPGSFPESPALSFTKKAQWSLEAQRLCTERALLQLEGTGTPTQLSQLDDAIAYARSQVVKFTSS
ncbi:hypothetical protein H310_08810 [Aphanomyces invadans]|uniref:Uncharacterized protein n=1 Tax=Aphanomyces invadans TaxID=157072 RepID=A0A024TXL8_9STRA|nr:hypothetical protein H310_08810 [Aphanomyces invadans]ETV98734.1 hypothetical protein H310_08810 [Aphanomyces invadans]|eukprot:XP_008872931.1 hypothetical protein H310_08810 [Aphanomyces invadans]